MLFEQGLEQKRIIRFRIVALLGIIAYIFWGLLYYYVDVIENSFLISLRVMQLVMISFLIYGSFKIEAIKKNVKSIFIFEVGLIIVHVFYLLHHFGLENGVVLLSVITVIFIISTTLETTLEITLFYSLVFILSLSLDDFTINNTKIALNFVLLNFMVFTTTIHIIKQKQLNHLNLERLELDRVLRSTPDIQLVVNANYTIIEYINSNNNVFCTNTHKKYVGLELTELFCTENQKKIYNILNSLGEGNIKQSFEYEVKKETLNYQLDARVVYVNKNKIVLRIRNVTKFAVIEDALNDTIEKSFRIARLAELGELSAGIAHEINNPVAIIDGSAKRIKKYLKNKDKFDFTKTDAKVDTIIESCIRITDIIHGLKDFSYDASKDAFEENSITEIMSTVNNLCSAKCTANKVKYITDIDDDLVLTCKRIQIEQVFVNLINNAVDAIENLANKWVKVEIKRLNEKSVIFSVTDSGAGIEEELAKKILEAFFTTKGAQKGTGLGLSLASKIIAKHGGKLQVDHTHQNTRFTFTLKINNAEQLSA